MKIPRVLTAIVAMILLAAAANAGTPRLIRVSPPGGQRGTTVEVEFIGRFLNQPREVLFYEPGISVETIEVVENTNNPNGKTVPVDSGTRVRVRMKIAAECPLGAHGIRLCTKKRFDRVSPFFCWAISNGGRKRTIKQAA